MPSTFVALSKISAPISLARRAAAGIGEKKGLPVPATKMTTRPLFEMAHGAAADERLGDIFHPMAV